MEMQAEKKLTANQLYKKYKEDGGTLSFSDWLNREKTKGVFPIYESVNDEVRETIEKYKRNYDMNRRTILGLPVGMVVLAGVIIVGSFVAYKYIKK